MQDNIKVKTINGITWSAIDSIAAQGITFIVGIVLARLLSPEEFGTIGIAMVFVALFNKIVDCGFSNALIRKHDASDIDYNTTFVFNLALSFLLYFVCFIVAPFISKFFDNIQLVGVIRWISLLLIINAFAIIQRTRLVKQINFKTQAKISIVSSVFSGIIGVLLAVKNFGVWSLVGQQLSRQLLNTLLLWCCNKWKPHLVFSFQRFKPLFSYGGKMMLSGLVDTLFNELTVIVVGKMYTPLTLGQYSRAKQFSGIFSSNLSIVMERVTFPVLTRFQGDNELLLKKYRKIVCALTLITGLGLAFICSCSRSIILILLGPKWTEAILYLQLLAFVEVTIPIKNVNLNLLQVYGRSDIILKLSVIKRFIELFAVSLGLISLPLMLIGFAVAGVIGLLLNMYYTNLVSGYKMLDQLTDISLPFIASVVVGLFMYLSAFCIDNVFLALLVQVVVGIATFLFLKNLMKLEEYDFLKQIVLNKLHGFKN